jgi:glycosyltransferase involved in cell wall biosynthesis
LNEKLDIEAVTWQTPITGGGGLRACRSIKEYVKYFNTYLFITWRVWNNKALLQKSIKYLYELKSCGARFAGFSFISGRTLRFLKVFGRRILETSMLLLSQLMRINVGLSKFDAVIALHEDWDVVYVGHALARSFNIPSIVFLHNPPFFGSSKRASNILKAITLWRMLQSSNVIERYLLKVEASITIKGGHFIGKKRYEEILQGCTAIIGISKATAVEMGGAWSSKMIYFDPGVSLDEEDMGTIRSIKERVKEKEAYVVFGGRPTAEKGVAEALVSFKIISKASS